MSLFSRKFPRRVRIHGGEFGASARAMHRKAALENVSRATIERKLMSTKTTFKRVALVAVAALTIGMVSAVPSNASPSAAYGTMFSGTAGNQIIGGQSDIFITLDTSTTAISNTVASSGVGTIVSAVVSTAGSGTSASVGTVSSTGFSAVGASGAANGVVKVIVSSSTVGTQTISVTPVDSLGVPGTAVTKTVTWLSGASNAVVNHSTAFLGAVSGSEVVADATQTPTAAASSSAIGQIDVRQYSDSGTTATATGSTAAVTASISGAGSVSTSASGGATGPSVTIAAGGGVGNRFTLYVYPNGVAGTGTITIAVGGVTVATKTVVFAGTLASFSATPTKTVIAVGGTDAVAIKGLDSNGNAASVGTYYVTSSNTAVATVPASVTPGGTSGTATVTGVAAGTAVITVANASSSPTITKTFTVTVGKATLKTVTISTDKTSYAAGEKVILTVTGIGSDGLSVGDATLNAFGTGGVTSNVALQGTLPGASVTFAGGVATYTIYAPTQDATVVLSATEGTSTDNVIAGGTAAAITTSFDVANASNSAAVDAANAATDAANYAADAADAATTAAQEATAAAQAAQDSADAATAAVVALGLRVDTLMASVRAQLTSLSNLLVRIIKKTHA